VRVFLDTNAIVSAVATRGLCADVFRLILAEHDLVVGEVVLDEVAKVLRGRFKLPSERVAEVEDLLRDYEVVAKPKAADPVMVRDAADRWVLASARAAGVDALVTGDADLLDIADEVPFRVFTPRDFWNEARRGGR
jgi:uncharacterized protein